MVPSPLRSLTAGVLWPGTRIPWKNRGRLRPPGAVALPLFEKRPQAAVALAVTRSVRPSQVVSKPWGETRQLDPPKYPLAFRPRGPSGGRSRFEKSQEPVDAAHHDGGRASQHGEHGMARRAGQQAVLKQFRVLLPPGESGAPVLVYSRPPSPSASSRSHRSTFSSRPRPARRTAGPAGRPEAGRPTGRPPPSAARTGARSPGPAPPPGGSGSGSWSAPGATYMPNERRQGGRERQFREIPLPLVPVERQPAGRVAGDDVGAAVEVEVGDGRRAASSPTSMVVASSFCQAGAAGEPAFL